MDIAQYQIVYREKGTGGPVLRKTFDGDAQVDVREITTQSLIRLRASDVSIYRHSLMIDNTPYDILNIVGLNPGMRPAQPLCVL